MFRHVLTYSETISELKYQTDATKNQKIKSSLYSPYYAEACNELRGPSPRLSAWATQLRRNVATVASRWRHCADLTGPGIEPKTSRTESERFATELTACHRVNKMYSWVARASILCRIRHTERACDCLLNNQPHIEIKAQVLMLYFFTSNYVLRRYLVELTSKLYVHRLSLSATYDFFLVKIQFLEGI